MLRLPQRLYGRERESETLLGAFERVAHGGKELLLVGGYSGIGKTALVHELYRPIVARRGYFISGKFDQFNRNIPYASLIQAVQQLVRQLLTEPAEALARWRERLLAAVGANGQVIVDVIHEVALVIGAQPPVPELPSKEAQNRFNHTFESFFRVFADESHPLAIFLDDLQWADLPSLRLIERLMTDAETKHLLLIGAYRDNEAEPGHPLLVTVESMREQGAKVEELSLAPLGREHVIGFLVDTLQCGREEAGPLAELCLRKTGGNPFFLGQFLLSLHERGELHYDTKAGRWAWDDQHISRMEMTDNVVDLMAGRIRNLAEPVQHTLRVAACIGNVFGLQTLAVGLGVAAHEAAAALWPALKEGLVLPLDTAYRFAGDEVEATGDSSRPQLQAVSYRFLHDRVQQAAYSLIPPELRGALHLQVGRQLRRGSSEAEREELLFSLVGHLNLGAQLIEEQEERDELAALNLAAARKAKDSTAYPAAKAYLQKGIALLGEDCFQRRRELAVALHLQAAEVSYLNKEFDRIDLYARAALEHDEDVLLRVKVAEIRIQAFNAQNKLGDAVRTALEILEVLGVHFPEQPTQADFLASVSELDAALAGRAIGSLLELPVLTEPVKVAALRILAMTIPTSYLYDPQLFVLLAVRQVAYSVAHGNAGPSASGYASWGIILCGALGRIDDGYEFGKLASRVLARYDARNYAARTEYIVSAFIAHNKEHVRQSVLAFKDIYRVGLETGDLDFAGYSLVSQATQLYLGGAELAGLDQLMASSIPALVQLRHEPTLNYSRAVRQLVHNLMGRTEDPCRLVGDVYDEEEMIAFHQEARDSYGLGSVFLWKLQLCYFFGRYAEALRHADALRTQLHGLVGQFQVPTALLFDSLAVLANHAEASPEARERLLARVEENLQRLKPFAEHAPMNHAHKYCLVQAERARVLGEPENARELYYRAISLAHEHEYRNEEALAAELFSRFAAGRGERELAGLFLEKAHHLYAQWGAKAKVLELERKHAELFGHAPARSGVRRASIPETTEHRAGAGERGLRAGSAVGAQGLAGALRRGASGRAAREADAHRAGERGSAPGPADSGRGDAAGGGGGAGWNGAGARAGGAAGGRVAGNHPVRAEDARGGGAGRRGQQRGVRVGRVRGEAEAEIGALPAHPAPEEAGGGAVPGERAGLQRVPTATEAGAGAVGGAGGHLAGEREAVRDAGQPGEGEDEGAVRSAGEAQGDAEAAGGAGEAGVAGDAHLGDSARAEESAELREQLRGPVGEAGRGAGGGVQQPEGEAEAGQLRVPEGAGDGPEPQRGEDSRAREESGRNREGDAAALGEAGDGAAAAGGREWAGEAVHGAGASGPGSGERGQRGEAGDALRGGAGEGGVGGG